MREWLSALCYIVLPLMLTNANTSAIPLPSSLRTSDDTSRSILANVTNPEIRSQRSKEDPEKDISITSDVTFKSQIAPSTLRTMIVPAYVRLHAAGKLASNTKHRPLNTQSSMKQALAEAVTKPQEIFEGALSTEPTEYSSKVLRRESMKRKTEMHPGMQDMHQVQHAALPQGVRVYPLPLHGSDHELQLNVTWEPSIGPPVLDYSIEVRSVTQTVDCVTTMCYEYNIPGNSRWWLVPMYPSSVAESCAVRPGCAYSVRLIAHPWDGHTSANLNIELDECVAGMCSCAHAPRLPTPVVSARALSIHGELFVNVTWELPPPPFPYRLPPGLGKKYYFVSIGKQMVSDAHPSPWFAHAVSRRIEVEAPVAVPEGSRWLLLPTVERSGQHGRERTDEQTQNIVLDVKLLARVNLIDERGCVGPAGNATAYDPTEANKVSIATYAVWAVFGGACVLAALAAVAASTRMAKRLLRLLRPRAASALEPLRARPAWLPMAVNGRANHARVEGTRASHSLSL